MRRLLLVFLLLAAAVAAWALTRNKSHRVFCYEQSRKPTPPITLEARIVGDPSKPFRIVAQASSALEGEVDLEVSLPPGITHLGGACKQRCKRPDLQIDACAAGAGRREIFVTATLKQGTARITRSVSLVLNEAPEPPKGALKKNSRGEDILEFDR